LDDARIAQPMPNPTDDTDPHEASNQRREPRHEVQVAGRYRSRVGASRDIWIKDISETGCRFFDKFSVLPVDTNITFRVGTIGPIPARVRWREKSVIGIQFETPLHPSVLEHIVRTMDEPGAGD
jgi:hypothetical protein